MPAAQPKVLLVEDEPAQREVLAYNLEAEGFAVARAGTGDDALVLVEEEMPDIIVLDWMLPGVSGIEICRRLKSRARTRGVPIIMVSARSEEVDRVRGLETGADDYVVKPFSLSELQARVKAVLRRAGSRPSRVSVGENEIDLDAHLVRRGERSERLLQKEADLLAFLLRHPGKTFSRSDLLREVWGFDVTPPTRTVDTHVFNLRRKLEADPREPRHLLTVHGVGYRLVT